MELCCQKGASVPSHLKGCWVVNEVLRRRSDVSNGAYCLYFLHHACPSTLFLNHTSNKDLEERTERGSTLTTERLHAMLNLLRTLHYEDPKCSLSG